MPSAPSLLFKWRRLMTEGARSRPRRGPRRRGGGSAEPQTPDSEVGTLAGQEDLGERDPPGSLGARKVKKLLRVCSSWPPRSTITRRCDPLSRVADVLRIPERVEVVTRRRRWSLSEKLRAVEEASAPGVTVSYIARKYGRSPRHGGGRRC